MPSKCLKEVWPVSSKQAFFFFFNSFLFKSSRCFTTTVENSHNQVFSRCWRSKRKYPTHIRPKEEDVSQHMALDRQTPLAVDPIGFWHLLTSDLKSCSTVEMKTENGGWQDGTSILLQTFSHSLKLYFALKYRGFSHGCSSPRFVDANAAGYSLSECDKAVSLKNVPNWMFKCQSQQFLQLD